MCYRLAVLAVLVLACCDTSFATAQEKKKKLPAGADLPAGGFGKKTVPIPRDVEFGGGFGNPRQPLLEEVPRGPTPAFLVTLEEWTKSRKVFLAYRDVAVNPLGAANAAREPYVTSINAVRRIQGDSPAQVLVYVQGWWRMGVPEEDVRKLLRFKKDFAKKISPVPDHVETARLSVSMHGKTFDFNLITGECQCGTLQVPDGFFDALADVLGDLDKLKAGKPSFDVK